MTGIITHSGMRTAYEKGLFVPHELRGYLVAYSASQITRCKMNAWRIDEALTAEFGPEAAHVLHEVGGTQLYLLIHPSDVVVVAAEKLVDLAMSGWVCDSDREHSVTPLMHELWRGMSIPDRLGLFEECDVEETEKVLEADFPLEVEYWLEALVES